jgi:transposase
MARQSRFSAQVKKQAVRDYQKGKRTVLEIVRDAGCVKSTVRKWLVAYNVFGPKGLEHKSRNRAYGKDEKIQAIQEYLDGQGSLEEISGKHELTTGEMLRKWVIKYNKHEDIGDYDPKGEVYMAKSRKTTYEERLEIAQHCLGHGKQYKLAAEIFNVPYASVYKWTKAYETVGEEALRDRRGRRKPEVLLTEEDKLRRELEREKAKSHRLETELELFKKKHEIEMRLGSRKSGKKRDT